jgi:PKD repeat protein
MAHRRTIRKVGCKVALPAWRDFRTKPSGDPTPMRFLSSVRRRRRSRGQSLVEFAITLPVILLIVMVGIDFGRVFLGWVNLNNTARIAANYAAANSKLLSAGNAAALASYRQLVANDARTINCALPNPIPAPSYPSGTDLGDDAQVSITCRFGIITPIISSVLGSPIDVSAASVFPIRTGIVAGVPGGGPPAPRAAFNASPTTGDAPLVVTFTDVSTNNSTWAWDFDGNGTVDSTVKAPPAWTYSVPGTYQPKLTVSNGITSDTATKTINVLTPPGPIADFTITPPTGTAPLTVSFTNTSTGTIVTWAWTFGDGTTSSVKDPPNKTYGTANTYSISLTVTDSFGLSSTTTKSLVVAAAIPMCTVPDFKGDTTSNLTQVKWQAAGFTTTVIFNPLRPPEYRIKGQSLTKNSVHPCNGTVITVTN